MKRVGLLFILILFVFTACFERDVLEPVNNGGPIRAENPVTDKNPMDEKKVIMDAIVFENNTTYLSVVDMEEWKESGLISEIHVGVSDVELLDKDGNEMEITEFKKGFHIKIEFNGAIMESYPAQLGETYSIRMIDVVENFKE